MLKYPWNGLICLQSSFDDTKFTQCFHSPNVDIVCHCFHHSKSGKKLLTIVK